MSKAPKYSKNQSEHKCPKKPRIERIATNQLRPATNCTRHSDKAVARFAAAIAQTGILVPIVIDQRGTIVAGQSLWLAALHLGLREVPVVRMDRRPFRHLG